MAIPRCKTNLITVVQSFPLCSGRVSVQTRAGPPTHTTYTTQITSHVFRGQVVMSGSSCFYKNALFLHRSRLKEFLDVFYSGMSQLPSTEPANTPPSPGPAPNPFDTLVQDYWNTRHDLLQSIPNHETRELVKAVIDGRVVERVTAGVPLPLRQGVAMSFSTLQETRAVFHLVLPFATQWAYRFLRDAVPYVAVVYYRYMQTPELKVLLENWDAKDSVVTTVLAAAAPWLALQGLAVAGFTASGVLVGSLAALWQSTIGNVVAGSLFASLQSIGAVGALGGPLGIAVGVAAAGGYGLYKLTVTPTPEARFNAMLLTLLQNEGERAQFWASINL